MRPDTKLGGSLRLIQPWAALSCLSPARSIALPHLHGHSRSSTVLTTSMEHGASTGAWVRASSEWSPRGVYSPALTRGFHGRARRGVSGHSWASAGLTRPYLKVGCAWSWFLIASAVLQDG